MQRASDGSVREPAEEQCGDLALCGSEVRGFHWPDRAAFAVAERRDRTAALVLRILLRIGI